MARFAPALTWWGVLANGRGLGFMALAVLFLGSPMVRADSLLLRGGERLIGRILAEDEGSVSFESQTLGVVTIPRDRIEKLEREAPPPPPVPAETATKKETSVSAPLAKQPGAATAAAKESIVSAPPPETPAKPAATPDTKDSIIPAPPPEPPAKTAATSTDKDSIVPTAPAEPAASVVQKDTKMPAPITVSTAKPADAVVAQSKATSDASPSPVASSTEEIKTLEPKIVPVATTMATTPAIATNSEQMKETPPAVTVAPATVTVFYPWSGLKTEQDTYDWVQLKSGEWLKGKIKGMQNFELEFDSEKLDLLTFDWKDVFIVRSPRLNSVWFGGKGETAAGSLLVTVDEVKVISATGTMTFSRGDLVAITPTGNRERNNWTGKLLLGLNLRSGNNTEQSYNMNASVQRRTPSTRLKLEYLGNYSYTNGVTNEDNIRSTAQFDYYFSRKLYVRFPDVEYYRDPLQNIEYRLTSGGAVGYEFYRTPYFEWDATAGPGYTNTQYISVEAGKSQSEKTGAVIFGTHMDWQITKLIEWIVDYRAQASGKQSAGGTTQHATSTLEFEIHKRLKLDLTFTWDRVGDPKPDENGTVPKPNDYRLTTSIGVDF